MAILAILPNGGSAAQPSGLFGCSTTAEGIPQLRGLLCVLDNIINVLLGAAGIVILIILVMGGIQYMVSGGDEKALAGAKKTITYSLLGLLIILVAGLFVNVILGRDLLNVRYQFLPGN